MANFVDFDLGIQPRKRRIETEKAPTPLIEVENEWTTVTKKIASTAPFLSPPPSQVKKYTYLSELEVRDIVFAHMKPQHANLCKMAYLELKTPTQVAVEMAGKKGFSLAQIKKFYKIFRTRTPL